MKKGASYIRDLWNCSQKHIKLLTVGESIIMKTLCTGGIKIPSRKIFFSLHTKQGDQSCAHLKTFLISHLHYESDEKDLKHLHFETIKQLLEIFYRFFIVRRSVERLCTMLYYFMPFRIVSRISTRRILFARILCRIQLRNNYTQLQSKVGDGKEI